MLSMKLSTVKADEEEPRLFPPAPFVALGIQLTFPEYIALFILYHESNGVRLATAR